MQVVRLINIYDRRLIYTYTHMQAHQHGLAFNNIPYEKKAFANQPPQISSSSSRREET